MISKLERVALDKLWKHETYDFTKWLFENCDILSEQIGLTELPRGCRRLHDDSARMLAGAYLQELSAEWISGRRYMDMAEFHEVKAEQERKEKASAKQPVNMAQPEAVAVST